MPQLEALQRVQVVRMFDIYEMLRALHEVRDCLSQQVGPQVPLLDKCHPIPRLSKPQCSFNTSKECCSVLHG